MTTVDYQSSGGRAHTPMYTGSTNETQKVIIIVVTHCYYFYIDESEGEMLGNGRGEVGWI